jgi:hypothetical protein
VGRRLLWVSVLALLLVFPGLAWKEPARSWPRTT